jgi:limonene-1,2-epoxide hydrolase
MKNIIEEFYEAFSNLDAESMVKYYHPDVVFQDPAFGELKGARAKNMWRMLCHSQKGKGFKVKYNVIDFNTNKSNAEWEAFYTFSQTGRKVHNKISASFVIENGLIVEHIDKFNLYSWSKQAMGIKGFLLGNTSFFRNKLQQKTNSLLNKFEEKQAQLKK